MTKKCAVYNAMGGKRSMNLVQKMSDFVELNASVSISLRTVRIGKLFTVPGDG